MKGGINRELLGYTIVEVMIVLAVSGLTFLIAANFINGKQQKTSFFDGVNQMDSNIQSVIQQVNSGVFSDIPVTCTGGSGSVSPANLPQLSTPSPSTATQGTNNSCVFVGKFLSFWTGSDIGYSVFTLVGNTNDPATGNPATGLSQVIPVPALTPSDSIDLTSNDIISHGLQIYTGGSSQGISVIDASGSVASGVYGFGFMQSLGNLVTGGSDSGTFVSGGQSVALTYVKSFRSPVLITPFSEYPQAYNWLRNNSQLDTTYAASAVICLTNGSQYADIEIGSTGTLSSSTYQNLNVTSHVVDNKANC